MYVCIWIRYFLLETMISYIWLCSIWLWSYSDTQPIGVIHWYSDTQTNGSYSLVLWYPSQWGFIHWYSNTQPMGVIHWYFDTQTNGGYSLVLWYPANGGYSLVFWYPNQWRLFIGILILSQWGLFIGTLMPSHGKITWP